MAGDEDRDGRTLEPTEQKIRKAREEGRTPSAREVTLFGAILGSLVMLVVLGTDRAVLALRELAVLFDNASWAPLSLPRLGALGRWLASGEAILLVCVVLAAMMGIGLAAGLAQGMPGAVFARLKPQWNRVSPGAGLKRIFGSAGRVEFLKTTVKFALFILVIGVVTMREAAGIGSMLLKDPNLVPGFMLDSAVRLVMAAAVCTGLLALLDIFWSRLSWRRELRMNHQEMREEHRQNEGDPLLKSRRRALGMDRVRRTMMSRVPGATVVVANPTHYAVALKYEQAGPAAPIVVAKGRDLIALRIREIAEASGVPVVEDKPLARALHGAVELDQMIPPDFYRAVAELLCVVASPKRPVPEARS